MVLFSNNYNINFRRKAMRSCIEDSLPHNSSHEGNVSSQLLCQTQCLPQTCRSIIHVLYIGQKCHPHSRSKYILPNDAQMTILKRGSHTWKTDNWRSIDNSGRAGTTLYCSLRSIATPVRKRESMSIADTCACIPCYDGG